MFEKELKDRLEKIFGFKKVRFDAPGESLEQETLFVKVERARSTIKDTQEIAQVSGELIVFANADKLPFGYFSKCIHKAARALTKDFFFYQMDENRPLYQNIVERKCAFVFLFQAQYDPEQGELTSINFATSEH